MSSLSRLLDGPTGTNGGLPSSPASASGSYYQPPADTKPKRKRPSRATAAFVDDDDMSSRRVRPSLARPLPSAPCATS